MLFSAQKLSDKTGVPPSTCRYWLVNLFSEFSPSKKAGKWDDSALELVKQIKELKSRGLENEEIRDLLKKDYPINAEEEKALVTKTAAEYYQSNLSILTTIVGNQQKHLELLEKIIFNYMSKGFQPPVNKSSKPKTKPATKKKAVTKKRKKLAPKKKATPKRKPVKKKPAKKKGWFQRVTGQ